MASKDTYINSTLFDEFDGIEEADLTYDEQQLIKAKKDAKNFEQLMADLGTSLTIREMIWQQLGEDKLALLQKNFELKFIDSAKYLILPIIKSKNTSNFYTNTPVSGSNSVATILDQNTTITEIEINHCFGIYDTLFENSLQAIVDTLKTCYIPNLRVGGRRFKLIRNSKLFDIAQSQDLQRTKLDQQIQLQNVKINLLRRQLEAKSLNSAFKLDLTTESDVNSTVLKEVISGKIASGAYRTSALQIQILQAKANTKQLEHANFKRLSAQQQGLLARILDQKDSKKSSVEVIEDDVSSIDLGSTQISADKYVAETIAFAEDTPNSLKDIIRQGVINFRPKVTKIMAKVQQSYQNNLVAKQQEQQSQKTAPNIRTSDISSQKYLFTPLTWLKTPSQSAKITPFSNLDSDKESASNSLNLETTIATKLQEFTTSSSEQEDPVISQALLETKQLLESNFTVDQLSNHLHQGLDQSMFGLNQLKISLQNARQQMSTHALEYGKQLELSSQNEAYIKRSILHQANILDYSSLTDFIKQGQPQDYKIADAQTQKYQLLIQDLTLELEEKLGYNISNNLNLEVLKQVLPNFSLSEQSQILHWLGYSSNVVMQNASEQSSSVTNFSHTVSSVNDFNQPPAPDCTDSTFSSSQSNVLATNYDLNHLTIEEQLAQEELALKHAQMEWANLDLTETNQVHNEFLVPSSQVSEHSSKKFFITKNNLPTNLIEHNANYPLVNNINSLSNHSDLANANPVALNVETLTNPQINHEVSKFYLENLLSNLDPTTPLNPISAQASRNLVAQVQARTTAIRESRDGRILTDEQMQSGLLKAQQIVENRISHQPKQVGTNKRYLNLERIAKEQQINQERVNSVAVELEPAQQNRYTDNHQEVIAENLVDLADLNSFLTSDTPLTNHTGKINNSTVSNNTLNNDLDLPDYSSTLKLDQEQQNYERRYNAQLQIVEILPWLHQIKISIMHDFAQYLPQAIKFLLDNIDISRLNEQSYCYAQSKEFIATNSPRFLDKFINYYFSYQQLEIAQNLSKVARQLSYQMPPAELEEFYANIPSVDATIFSEIDFSQFGLDIDDLYTVGQGDQQCILDMKKRTLAEIVEQLFDWEVCSKFTEVYIANSQSPESEQLTALSAVFNQNLMLEHLFALIEPKLNPKLIKVLEITSLRDYTSYNFEEIIEVIEQVDASNLIQMKQQVSNLKHYLHKTPVERVAQAKVYLDELAKNLHQQNDNLSFKSLNFKQLVPSEKVKQVEAELLAKENANESTQLIKAKAQELFGQSQDTYQDNLNKALALNFSNQTESAPKTRSNDSVNFESKTDLKAQTFKPDTISNQDRLSDLLSRLNQNLAKNSSNPVKSQVQNSTSTLEKANVPTLDQLAYDQKVTQLQAELITVAQNNSATATNVLHTTKVSATDFVNSYTNNSANQSSISKTNMVNTTNSDNVNQNQDISGIVNNINYSHQSVNSSHSNNSHTSYDNVNHSLNQTTTTNNNSTVILSSQNLTEEQNNQLYRAMYINHNDPSYSKAFRKQLALEKQIIESCKSQGSDPVLLLIRSQNAFNQSQDKKRLRNKLYRERTKLAISPLIAQKKNQKQKDKDVSCIASMLIDKGEFNLDSWKGSELNRCDISYIESLRQPVVEKINEHTLSLLDLNSPQNNIEYFYKHGIILSDSRYYQEQIRLLDLKYQLQAREQAGEIITEAEKTDLLKPVSNVRLSKKEKAYILSQIHKLVQQQSQTLVNSFFEQLILVRQTIILSLVNLLEQESNLTEEQQKILSQMKQQNLVTDPYLEQGLSELAKTKAQAVFNLENSSQFKDQVWEKDELNSHSSTDHSANQNLDEQELLAQHEDFVAKQQQSEEKYDHLMAHLSKSITQNQVNLKYPFGQTNKDRVISDEQIKKHLQKYVDVIKLQQDQIMNDNGLAYIDQHLNLKLLDQDLSQANDSLSTSQNSISNGSVTLDLPKHAEQPTVDSFSNYGLDPNLVNLGIDNLLHTNSKQSRASVLEHHTINALNTKETANITASVSSSNITGFIPNPVQSTNLKITPANRRYLRIRKKSPLKNKNSAINKLLKSKTKS